MIFSEKLITSLSFSEHGTTAEELFSDYAKDIPEQPVY